MALSFDQQKRQDIILPFYLICVTYLSFVLMHQLIGGFSDFWPVVVLIIVQTDCAPRDEVGPDDMEIIFYVSLPVAAINESKDESLFFGEAHFFGIFPDSDDVVETSG